MAKEKQPLPQVPATDPLVGPFLQNPAAHAMTVAWIRADDRPCEFSFGTGPDDRRGLTVSPKRAIEGEGDFFYEVVLPELNPDTCYSYALRCPGGTAESAFRTFPARVASGTFIYYGDNKSDFETHERVATLLARHEPAFVMHSGDMTDHGGYEEYRPYFFYPLRNVIDHIPLLPGRGNHEGNGNAYRQVFSLPEGDTWYSCDYGPVHVVVLDTTGWRHECEKDDISRMYKWCEEDLSATEAVWKLVMHHEPCYDLGWRKDDWGHKDFLPLLRRHGVDVMLSGHAHGYQRLHPMKTPSENDANPITHIVSAGAGGAIGSKPVDDSVFLAAEFRRHNYVLFTLEGESLRGRVFSDADELLDEFMLEKPGGAYTPSFLAAAMDERQYP